MHVIIYLRHLTGADAEKAGLSLIEHEMVRIGDTTKHFAARKNLFCNRYKTTIIFMEYFLTVRASYDINEKNVASAC